MTDKHQAMIQYNHRVNPRSPPSLGVTKVTSNRPTFKHKLTDNQKTICKIYSSYTVLEYRTTAFYTALNITSQSLE